MHMLKFGYYFRHHVGSSASEKLLWFSSHNGYFSSCLLLSVWRFITEMHYCSFRAQVNYILVVHAPVHFTNDARSPNPSRLQLAITNLHRRVPEFTSVLCIWSRDCESNGIFLIDVQISGHSSALTALRTQQVGSMQVLLSQVIKSCSHEESQVCKSH